MSLSQSFIIGQYVHRNSIIHRLDPRAKLVITFLFMLSVMLLNSWLSYVLSAVFVAGVVTISQIPPSYIVRGLKPVWLIVIVTSVFHIFLTQGGQLWLEAGVFSIYEEGVIKAGNIAIRIILLLVIASLLTLTTKLGDLAQAIEDLLKPAKRLGVPTQEFALMISWTIRFIPILLNETDNVMKAQRARGVRFNSGNIVRRLRSFIPIVVPILLLAFQKAESASLAVEARGYSPGMNRTQLRTLAFKKLDYQVLIISIFCFALLLALRK
ncbi:energy-coupling factor transporter transmembrane protein EcfT [Paenibacillus polymyxa]|uniref:energy-coupling factor transporter transmembrane component T family protein n=1 Tax=Paenibacillus polymyxa TaxID=1406 RepID=UPI001BE89C33|nr:energy-coupling factor transporter transmembrane component T [Paenibacillus polymyxa]MBT2285921.1 energy-coupling factor transporter transmembrane protein EcfT [Paenibacillus polymyxa]